MRSNGPSSFSILSVSLARPSSAVVTSGRLRGAAFAILNTRETMRRGGFTFLPFFLQCLLQLIRSESSGARCWSPRRKEFLRRLPMNGESYRARLREASVFSAVSLQSATILGEVFVRLDWKPRTASETATARDLSLRQESPAPRPDFALGCVSMSAFARLATLLNSS